MSGFGVCVCVCVCACMRVCECMHACVCVHKDAKLRSFDAKLRSFDAKLQTTTKMPSWRQPQRCQVAEFCCQAAEF